MSIRPIVIGAVLVVGAAIAAAALIGPRQVVSAPGSEAAPRAISVTGIGDSKARPDVALITSGVVSEAATAREALAKNSAAMAAVIDALKKAGIKEEDIQTSNFNVSPQYPPYQPNQTTAPRISGYQVSNQVTARVTKIADLGAILDTLVQSGANQVNGISFDVAEPKAALNDARKEAVADARAKAELYAQAAGVKLGRVLAISESSNVVPPMPMAFRAMDKVEAQAVPIAAGQVTLNANVSIVYEIE